MRLRLLFAVLLIALLTSSPALSQTSDIEASLNALATLDFDSFLDESYYLLLRRHPELLIELSLQDELGLDEISLNNLSDAYLQESEMLERAILAQLRERDREALSSAQQISYDIYEWYLDDRVRAQEFRLYDYPVSFFLTADQHATASFFTEIHPLETVQDAEDYISRLWLVDDKFEQIIEKVNLRTEAGIIPPRSVIEWTMNDLNRLSSGRVQSHDYYRALAEGINEISDLSDAERETLLADAAEAMQDAVMPAYARLAATMSALIDEAPLEFGVWQYSDGEAFYNYALRHHTTTELSAQEIHELGLQELERIHAEMRVLFEELGYNPEYSIANLYRLLSQNDNFVPAHQVVATFESFIDEAYPRLETAFSRIPEAQVVVIGVQQGGYYIPAALDGSRPGAFYASSTTAQASFNMRSLLYHEAIPGHHLQIAWAQELDLPAFRCGPLFTSYVEGWGLYAERLAYDLGWYEDDPLGNLGRLQYEAFRAARLVVDTGIHAQRWSFGEAVDFFADNTGFSTGMAQGQIARYVVWAGQSTAYMVGMLEILRQREAMQSALGDDFDLITFHDIVLNNGSLPLAVLDSIVGDYIDEIP